MKKSAHLIILSSLVILITLFSKSVLAQQSSLGLSAIPPRLEITDANPGDVLTKEIKVRNESRTEKVITVSVEDFIVVDDLGTPVRIETESQNDNRWAAANWIQVSPTQVKLKPGETKALVLTLLVPQDATPGGHYAMVLYNHNADTTITQTGAAIETKVGSLVYVTVPGDITENAQVKEFSTKKFFEYGPVDFKTIITNLSDIHIAPAGSINIYNTLGLRSHQLKLSNTNIFPYTSREFDNTLNRKFMFGYYRAKLNAVYGPSGKPIDATLSFWVIPYKIVILVLIILIPLIFFIRQRKKNPPKTQNNPQVEALEQELEALKKKYQDRS